jgi:hypothetical protein
MMESERMLLSELVYTKGTAGKVNAAGPEFTGDTSYSASTLVLSLRAPWLLNSGELGKSTFWIQK